MVLGCDPAYIDVSWILTRKYSYSVKILVHEFQTVTVVNFVSNRFDARTSEIRWLGRCGHRGWYFEISLKNITDIQYHVQYKMIDCSKILTVEARVVADLPAPAFMGAGLAIFSVSPRARGSGVLALASGDFTLREKNLKLHAL